MEAKKETNKESKDLFDTNKVNSEPIEQPAEEFIDQKSEWSEDISEYRECKNK